MRTNKKKNKKEYKKLFDSLFRCHYTDKLCGTKDCDHCDTYRDLQAQRHRDRDPQWDWGKKKGNNNE